MTLSRTTRRALVAGIALATVGTLVGIGATALAGTSDPSASEPALSKLPPPPKAPRSTGKAAPGTLVPNSYIVVFKKQKAKTSSAAVHAQSASLTALVGGKVRHEYSGGFSGFSATMTAAQAKRLATDSRVAYVEQDRLYSLQDVQSNPPNWGLDRIDQTYLPLNKSYTPPSGGAGVTAYIIDSGIRVTHQEFEGRASYGINELDGTTNADDCSGHGTHVAGIVGGKTFGVAKKVNLVAVKVAGCDDTVDDVNLINGIKWVTDHAQKPAVANLSIGGPPSTALDDAVRESIASGVAYAVAAGNGDKNNVRVNACTTSPADVAEAITVGATAINDFAATFSNYGSCVDVLAPGVLIRSAYYTGDTATFVMGGTSMAAPHVTGAAALLLAADPTLTPAQIQTKIKDSAVKQAIHNAGPDTPNLLLNVNGTASTNTLGFRSWVNGQYVSAASGGNSSLIANRWVMGGWETFDIVPQADGYVALKSHANGKYVTAENAGAKPLIANRTSVGVWEEFKIDTAADYTIGLIARANGKYVTADNSGNGPLIAKTSFKGSAETFIPSGPNAVISITAEVNSKYVTAENAGAKPLIANRASVGSWEQFDIIDLGEGWVAFRAHANGKYVTAESAGAKPLIANRAGVGSWEAFYLFYWGDALAIGANANLEWVTADGAGSKPLIANRDVARSWEFFAIS